MSKWILVSKLMHNGAHTSKIEDTWESKPTLEDLAGLKQVAESLLLGIAVTRGAYCLYLEEIRGQSKT
jgi:hypothetical protein